MNYEYFEQNLGTGPFGMYRTYWIIDYRFVNITGEPKAAEIKLDACP